MSIFLKENKQKPLWKDWLMLEKYEITSRKKSCYHLSLEGFPKSHLEKVCLQARWELSWWKPWEVESGKRMRPHCGHILEQSIFSLCSWLLATTSYAFVLHHVLYTLILCQYRSQMMGKATVEWNNEVIKLYQWLSLFLSLQILYCELSWSS